MEEKAVLKEQLAVAKKKLAQLQNQQKILLNKQRDTEYRARNHRLIVHGAILEGVFPVIASMEAEAVKAFLIALSRLSVTGELLEKAQETRERE